MWCSNKHKVTNKFSLLPAEKQIETCFREQNVLPAEDGLTTDVRTNICRYKTYKEANIHLEIINRYQKNIKQYYTINNENKLNINQQNCFWQGNLEKRHFNNLPTDF